jgi:hypothetical protein
VAVLWAGSGQGTHWATAGGRGWWPASRWEKTDLREPGNWRLSYIRKILDPFCHMQPAAPARVCHWKRHPARQGTCNNGSASHRKAGNAARISLYMPQTGTRCTDVLQTHAAQTWCLLWHAHATMRVCSNVSLTCSWESLGLTGRGAPNMPCWPIGSCSTGCGQSKATVARCVHRHMVQRLAASSCHAPARPHLPANL